MVWPLSATGPNLQQGITHAYSSYPAQLTRVDQGATALKGKLNFAAVDAEGAERIADVTADQCEQRTMTSAWNSVFRRSLRSSFSVGERYSNWRITRSAANPLSRCLQLREDFEGERTVAGFEAYYEKVKDMGAKPASVVQELTTSVIHLPSWFLARLTGWWQNFDSKINVPLALVKFYAPWCGHCKVSASRIAPVNSDWFAQALAPTWELLATKLHPDVLVAKVDVTVHNELQVNL